MVYTSTRSVVHQLRVHPLLDHTSHATKAVFGVSTIPGPMARLDALAASATVGDMWRLLLSMTSADIFLLPQVVVAVFLVVALCWSLALAAARAREPPTPLRSSFLLAAPPPPLGSPLP